MQVYLDSMSAGKTQKYLSLKVLRYIQFVLPPREILDSYNNCMINYGLKNQENREQIQTLTKLRDTLLPKLISGELRLDEENDSTRRSVGLTTKMVLEILWTGEAFFVLSYIKPTFCNFFYKIVGFAGLFCKLAD